MDVRNTDLPGVVVLKPRRFADRRGYFVETYNPQAFRDAGVTATFVQDSQSLSIRRGTIRGLHFQLPPEPQAKLVRVIKGSIFDVAVDLRAGSPTFGRWTGLELSAQSGEQVFIPVGFAHGFCTLEPMTEVAYKIDRAFAPQFDSGIHWRDPGLAIAWPIPDREATLSEKDRALGLFSEFKSPFRWIEDAPA